MKGEKILGQLERAPVRQDFPSADAVSVFDETVIRLEPDGRVKKRIYSLKRVFTFFGRERNSDIHVLFNERHQKLDIVSARTYHDKGVVETPEYGINQITPQALEKAPHYVDFQEKIISLVGVTPEGFLEVEYEVEDIEPWQSIFCGMEPIRLPIPALKRRIRFEVPRQRRIKFSFPGCEDKPVPGEEVKGDFRILTFEFDELPQWDPEDEHVMVDAERPAVLYREEDPSGKTAAAIRKVIEENAAVSKSIERRVEEIVKEVPIPLERALKLHKHVVEAVSTIEISPLLDNFRSRKAEDILRSGYGNPFEKAVLLKAMLGASGLEAEVGLAFPEPLIRDGDYPMPLFKSIWVLVGSLDLPVRPDKALKEASRVDLEGYHLLLVTKTGEGVVKCEGPGNSNGNKLQAKARITLNKDFVLEGEVEATLCGLYNPYYGFRDEKKDAPEKWAKDFVKKIWPKAELKDHGFTHMDREYSSLKATLKGERLEEDSDHRFIIALPVSLTNLSGLKIPWEYSDRGSLYEIAGTLEQAVSVEIVLPGNLEPKLMPKEIDIKNGVGRVKLTLERKDEKLTVDYVAKIDRKFIAKDEYSGLKALLAADSKELARTFLLVRKS